MISANDKNLKNNTALCRAQIVAQEIQEDIIKGVLLPHTALIEVEMVSKYNASRNTIREAMHLLEADGLTNYIRNKGVFVRQVNEKDIKEIFQARRIIESQAIVLFKEGHNEIIFYMSKDLEIARLAIENQDWQTVGTMSLRFHQHLVSVIGNSLINVFFIKILAQLRLVFAIAPNEEKFQTPWVEEDRRILSLLKQSRYEEAYKVLDLYLDISEKNILRMYNSFISTI